jgi:predicted dehydrogenase
MSTDRLRLALVGLGPRGVGGWLGSIGLVPRAELVAVCDRHPALLAEGARRAGLPERDATTDLDDVLARPDVDAVVICVAPELQADLAVRSLEAGKAALCEVPLCYTIDDCWRIVLAAERSDRVLALGEQVCHAGFVNAWRALRADGALGRVLYAEAEYHHGIPSDWYWVSARTGSAVSWEDAASTPDATRTRFWSMRHPAWYNPHSLSPLLRVLDDRVESVVGLSTGAPSSVLPGLDAADLEVALARTAGGTVVRISTAFVAPTAHPWHWYRVLGTEGEVQTTRESEHGVPDGSGLEWYAKDASPARRRVTWSNAEHQRNAALAAASGHQGLDFSALEDFVEAVLDDRPPTVDVYRAAEIAAVGILAGRSADDGGAVYAVPDFRPGPERVAGRAPSVGS